jgi:hypothetical protein
MRVDDLLAMVLAAHGGQDRWSRISRIEAEMTIGGPFWKLKGQPDLLASETIEADAHTQHLAMTPLSGDFERSCVLQVAGDLHHISIREGETDVVESRDDPRQSFTGYDSSTQWDVLQTAYFISYASWTYLTEPFVLAYPGVSAREIEPWHEGGQVWRRLAVTFPPSLATHSATQMYYFGDEGLQRRLDYEPVVNGNAKLAHYTDRHEVFNGFTVPTRRRVHRRLPDGSADMSFATITLDLTDLAFT